MTEPIAEAVDLTDTPAAAPEQEVQSQPPAAPEQDSADTDVDDQGDGTDVGKARREAAKYRTQLRETESERDSLRDQLTAQRRAIVDWRATSSSRSVDPALLDAAEINVDELLDENGHLDMTAVDTFIDATVKRFNLAQGFTVNRGQGQSGAPAAPMSLADAFRQR